MSRPPRRDREQHRVDNRTVQYLHVSAAAATPFRPRAVETLATVHIINFAALGLLQIDVNSYYNNEGESGPVLHKDGMSYVTLRTHNTAGR